MIDLGTKLKQIRQDKKLSLRELAKLAHLSHSFIADIESGRSNPSIDTLTALSKTLEVSLQDLIGNSSNQDIIDAGSVDIQSPCNKDVLSELPPEALKEIEDFLCYIQYKYKIAKKTQTKK